MPGHRQRRGVPDGGKPHLAQAHGRRLQAQHAREQAELVEAATISELPVSILAETVELDLPPQSDETPRQYVGFATDPGYIDNFDQWGNRPVDDYPKHV